MRLFIRLNISNALLNTSMNSIPEPIREPTVKYTKVSFSDFEFREYSMLRKSVELSSPAAKKLQMSIKNDAMAVNYLTFKYVGN